MIGLCPECNEYKELHESCKRGNCDDCGCPASHEPRCIDWDEIDRNRAAREAAGAKDRLMSLDVYLTIPGAKIERPAQIFVREDGQKRVISREEWDARSPGVEPVTLKEAESECVYSANITHNLARMAEESGLYDVLWRPNEVGITTARQLIEPLAKGFALLTSDPARFEKFNSENGWGLYKNFVPFVGNYLKACVDNPDALVSVWR